jgi:hypothetical protein
MSEEGTRNWITILTTLDCITHKTETHQLDSWSPPQTIVRPYRAYVYEEPQRDMPPIPEIMYRTYELVRVEGECVFYRETKERLK